VVVAVAWALRAAGHDVRVAAQPDLADAIVQAGLTAVPVGNALDLAELSRRARQRPEEQNLFGSRFDITETWE
jgi:UDP:flavonoid glycosyltransferase YjiC (YdhE family)